MTRSFRPRYSAQNMERRIMCFCGIPLKSGAVIRHHLNTCSKAFPCICGAVWFNKTELFEYQNPYPIWLCDTFYCRCGARPKQNGTFTKRQIKEREPVLCLCDTLFDAIADFKEHLKYCPYVIIFEF